MFLIVDGVKIVRLRIGQFLIGSDAAAELRFRDPGIASRHVVITRNEVGGHWLQNVSNKAVRLNDKEIRDDKLHPLPENWVLALPGHTIESVSPEGDSPRVRAMRRKTSDLEETIHTKILDDAKKQARPEGEADSRQMLETLLEKVLGLVNFKDVAFEAYLATQWLHRSLINRVNAYDDSTSPDKRGPQLDVVQAALLAAIEEKLAINEDRNAAEKTERVDTLLPWLLSANKHLLDAALRTRLALALLREELLAFMFDLGPIADLRTASAVNDIMVLPSGQIFVERNGIMQDSGRRMLSPEISRGIIQRIVQRADRRIDRTNPIADAQMEDGSRLNAVIEPVSLGGPSLTIRRFSERRQSLSDLVERKTLPENVADFLAACVKARKNIIICGGTGSGKTTLLSALAACIGPSERIVTIEDTAELRLTQSHVVGLQARPPNREGEHAIAIRDLLVCSLRMRPDRIIVGECRGGEALDMLQAMNTGHDGSFTTLHANSPYDGIRRLEALTLQAQGHTVGARAIREQIASALDIVIQISRMGNHWRRVTSVCQVTGIDEESGSVLIEEVFGFRKGRSGTVNAATPLSFTGYIPSFFGELLEAGAQMSCLA